MTYLVALLVPLVIVLAVASQTFGVNQEYQRAVLFRLGRLGTTKGPGWYWLIPLIDRVVKVDIRTVTVQLETQETITRDGVAVRVNAVLWYRAADPARVVTSVEAYQAAVVQAAETGMRDAIGQSDLDQMLKDRIGINRRLLDLLAAAAGRWGVEVDAVEIKDVDIPEQMQRAIAREAEAIREKRAHHQGGWRERGRAEADRGRADDRHRARRPGTAPPPDADGDRRGAQQHDHRHAPGRAAARCPEDRGLAGGRRIGSRRRRMVRAVAWTTIPACHDDRLSRRPHCRKRPVIGRRRAPAERAISPGRYGNDPPLVIR